MATERFTRLQLRIMQVLWQKKRVTAREITDALQTFEPIAHSTVQTLLRRLELRGAVGHEVDGVTFVYFPLVQNAPVIKKDLQEFLDRMFKGSPHGMVSYLIKNRYISQEELRELSGLTEKKKG